jgi:rhodanese-related sulfurtransferase
VAADEKLAHARAPRISVEELKRLLEQKADIVVVDTRDSGSYDGSHIPGAVNIYYDEAGNPTDSETALAALPMDKPIVIYCP